MEIEELKRGGKTSNITIRPDLHRKLKQFCSFHHVYMNRFIEAAIEEAIDTMEEAFKDSPTKEEIKDKLSQRGGFV